MIRRKVEWNKIKLEIEMFGQRGRGLSAGKVVMKGRNRWPLDVGIVTRMSKATHERAAVSMFVRLSHVSDLR